MLRDLPGVVCTGRQAGEPVQPRAFEHAGIVKAWNNYRHKLSFGTGQTLALVDDGCRLPMPEFGR